MATLRALAKAVSKKDGMPDFEETRKILTATVDEIKAMLVEGNELEIGGFIKFYTAASSASANPKENGEKKIFRRLYARYARKFKQEVMTKTISR